MKNQIQLNNRKGYGEKAYNHVKKKGGILWHKKRLSCCLWFY